MKIINKFTPISNKKDLDIVVLILSTYDVKYSEYQHKALRASHFPLVLYWFDTNITGISSYTNFTDSYDLFTRNNLTLLTVKEIMDM